MEMTRTLSVLCSLLAVCGCSWQQIRLPWQQPNVHDQNHLLELLEQQDGRLTPGRDKLEQNQGKPRIIELEDSGLRPVSQKAMDRCVMSLAMPAEQLKPADSSNFGDREPRDAWGRRLQAHPKLIVLHETVISGPQTVVLFQTHHPDDDQQASYHLLIDRDGSRLRIVPDQKRAFGAGMSAFGDVTQRTKSTSVGSINNIALHVSLVSPEDGRDDRDGHSGYTDAQYKSLAGQVLLWQAAFGIPMTRVTTHAAVDRSHSRYDPRSFRWDRFEPHYRAAVSACGFPQFDNLQAGL